MKLPGISPASEADGVASGPSPSPMSSDRPSVALLGCEPLRAALEFVSTRLSPDRTDDQGDGHPVVVFPGLGTNGCATSVLRGHCRALGYDALDWGRGFNTGPSGDLDLWLLELQQHVASLLDERDGPATLIGWSLGGLYARELAKLMPRRVRQVITIGTPFNAGVDHTHVGWLYRLLNGRSGAVDAALAARLRTPPPVTTTSIYSRSDGVVAWHACRHAHPTSRVHEIEVGSSHIGMGWNRAVLAAVGQRLGA